ncbi:protein CsuE, partial [Sphingomonas sp. RB3P16]
SLAVIYTSPSSTTDDVDFSSNNGSSWTYDPSATPRAVTNVRIRPRGTMAAGSKYTVSLPYALF